MKILSDQVAKYGTRKHLVKQLHKADVRTLTAHDAGMMRLTRIWADQMSCNESMPSRTLVILPDEIFLLFCPSDWQLLCQPKDDFLSLYIRQIQIYAR
ncbi:hypothetical protein TH9_00500 [Thalassospira xiamenensis]|nr:hypothetical protein TH9_00500 [Thalassospira xiamenensis]